MPKTGPMPMLKLAIPEEVSEHGEASARVGSRASGLSRRLPVGAELVAQGGVHFRVWAPRCQGLQVVLEGGPGAESGTREIALEREPDGYFSGLVAEAGPGTLYRFRLDHRKDPVPDPVSRFQPEGPEGPSRVEDPARFAWTDHGWSGVTLAGQVIYELHVGTFTAPGTWEAATRELAELAALGITVIELMPVADFAGNFGWGYDCVDLFAPTRLYGEPDDFRRFVDRAHALGMGVILDVVYNHLGPKGNYLGEFSRDYFSKVHTTDWGDAINYDAENSGPVREFYLSNVGYWIDEFHLDGMRIDATQDIHDSSDDHILTAMTRQARQAARGRSVIIIAENEPQHTQLVRPAARGGHGMDALWNDDFHHSAMVALTGKTEAYYTDYRGMPQEFISAAKYGYLYQGQRYKWQKKRRGTPGLDLEPARFVNYIQNHDQIANSGRGLRAHQLTSPGRYRAMMALLLLAPGTPMLFQGQEFAASSPFFYFADHDADLNSLVCRGRNQFLAQFPSLATPEMQELLPNACAEDTFLRSKLHLGERERHAEVYALTRDLLALRRRDPVFRAQRHRGLDGAVLGADAFVLRFFAKDTAGDSPAEHGGDRLLVVNFGMDLHLDPAPEPLLGPPEGQCWTILWSSEHPRYGGTGTPPVDSDDNWHLPGHAAVVLAPAAALPASESGDEQANAKQP